MKNLYYLFILSFLLISCEDDDSFLIDFFSNHSNSVWKTSDGWYLRINKDSSDEYHRNKCINFPVADGTYKDWDTTVIFNQKLIRNEKNFVS